MSNRLSSYTLYTVNLFRQRREMTNFFKMHFEIQSTFMYLCEIIKNDDYEHVDITPAFPKTVF